MLLLNKIKYINLKKESKINLIMKQNKGSRIKKWFLAIGIAIIFTLFINYGISTFFNAPDYNEYCVHNQTELNYNNKSSCISSGGQWTETAAYGKPVPPDYQTGYCDIDFTCRKSYDDAQKIYDDRSFTVMVIAGFLALVIGVLVSVESISSGFLLGGILNLLFATLRYWDRFSNVIKFVLLGVVLLVLVWIGYKRLK